MLDIQKHKTLLLQILKDIYTDITIAPFLGFKGGTACFIFYGLPRFSIDIDLDLLNLKKSSFIYERIEEILKNYGEIKEKYKKKNTLFFLLSYEQKSKNIKIEVSLRSFGSRYEIKNYLGISMLVMTREDIFAHKLAALLERKQQANRDLYDICFFLKNRWSINEEILKKRTGMETDKYLKKCIAFIEKKITQRNVLSGMGELLDEKQKIFVKNKLKDEILFLLKLYREKT